jgi:pimeloyl-ACP methyl ester carboxylesterase
MAMLANGQKVSVTPIAELAKAWTSILSTSRADIHIRQSGGRGSPILFLHGEGESMEAFATLFTSSAANGHRLIAIDLPERGQSGKDNDLAAACTAYDQADLALEVLERLGIDTAFVVDRSPGGCIGRELMTMFPGMRGLLIVGGGDDSRGVDASSGPVPVFEISESAHSLEPALLRLAASEAPERAPLAWLGG